jgi:PIN domain nuclease of toxin-antitoxin system
MTLLDAYAVLALLVDEPASAEVEAILDAGGARVVVVNLAEAVDVTQRVHGRPARTSVRP